jgi:hypothetical protein
MIQHHFFHFALIGDELVERLAPFDILCVMRERTPFPKELIERLPNLKLLITSGPTNVLLTPIYLDIIEYLTIISFPFVIILTPMYLRPHAYCIGKTHSHAACIRLPSTLIVLPNVASSSSAPLPRPTPPLS